ncbi:uridine kinase [Microvenator marinus]|jgi:uridine kinase|uniref:Uridine kinase n=1 Tax=Microvenator marinus TaxID=2600177 RepID=A0A5B8XN16_9DELT|nr:uridine kinase [Microvenator marinus]QED26925.1 uridine kinase [Microvenator marinus]
MSTSNPKPVIVGVAGGTGSGKTTLAYKVLEGVGVGAALLSHDWYYKDLGELTLEERASVNFDHPNSLDNELLMEHLQLLKDGQTIEAPQYDFATHSRVPQGVEIKPCPVIVVEGILLFAIPDLRRLFDIKLFVDTDADIRVLRRVRRDIRDRGRDFESIRTQYYQTVRPMHLEFVEPSKRWADLIIPEGGENAIALDVIIERLKRFTA